MQPDNRRSPGKAATGGGCISGLLHLLSRRRHRKRLPSPTPPSPSKPAEPPAGDGKLRGRPCDAPRSPTLPPELRRPDSPDSPRRASALVARLMGLEEVAVEERAETAEKRRRLLGALERCDEDLRALKRVIEAVKVAERSAAAECLETNGDQPSPVSVLDALSSPRCRPQSPQCSGGGEYNKKARITYENCSFLNRISIEELPRVLEHKEELMGVFGSTRWRIEDSGQRWRRRRSRAMLESVGEVWEDVMWEERWELERVGVVLEEDIFGDLVEEVVLEMLGCFHKFPFPLDTCRKRLFF